MTARAESIIPLTLTDGLSRNGEPRNDFIDHSIGARFDFLPGLILNRMRDINGVEICASERGGLCAGCRHEFLGGDGDRRNSHAFKAGRIVQTARCA